MINDDRVTEWVRAAAIELLGEDNVLPIEPMTLAEDFSFLANEAPGTFFWVGAALPRPRMHHEADFDIDRSGASARGRHAGGRRHPPFGGDGVIRGTNPDRATPPRGARHG